MMKPLACVILALLLSPIGSQASPAGPTNQRAAFTALARTSTLITSTPPGVQSCVDTRTLANGVHTIAWVVRDSLGRAQGIGSRYFTVQNP